MSMPLYRMAKEIVLPKGEKAILTELCDHMNDNTGMCYPSRERLAKLTGYDVSSVTRHLKNLRNRGLISWITVRRAGQFGFNSYEINRDALSHAANVHMANNDNTELHSVSSPSGMVQHKPPEKTQYITTSSSEGKVVNEAAPKLSEKQLIYAKKLALQYYEKYKDEFYNFDSLFEGTKVFLASKQTEEDWRKIGNGLPSPKDMGWL